jgi:hypothetical protein
MNIQSIKKLGIYPAALPYLAGLMPQDVFIGTTGVIPEEEALFVVNEKKFLVNLTGQFPSGILCEGKDVAKLANQAPASSTSSGDKNDIYIAGEALYVCVEDNYWKKADLVDFFYIS